MDNLKILIIDDKKIIGDVFDITLGRKGHEIKYASCAAEALKLVKDSNFDIAFLDIILPDKDGITILAEIKKLKPNLPVVMMSGYAVDGKKDQSKKLGACAMMKKPFAIDDIRAVVKQAIGKEI